jgi:4-hydroxy-3-methylbut-2-enyl diphosphate reductase
MIEIEIDKSSGFCFGVVNAIESAERELQKDDSLYCLGDLVHNNLEMKRLKDFGLKTIHIEELATLRDKTVLLRAHGEPPSTYITANENNIKILDATCPVVLHLQKRIKDCYEEIKNTDTQLVIYGKKGHAEVNGLVGQTEGKAIVIEKTEDLERLDFEIEIVLFSQTTKPLNGFSEIVETIKSRMKEGVKFRYFDTICRQVANRLPKIKEFANAHDWIYFVAGEKSSNGKLLFEECKKTNPNTVFISESAEIKELLPKDVRKVGVCGATSTPKWLMEEVAERIRTLNEDTTSPIIFCT